MKPAIHARIRGVDTDTAAQLVQDELLLLVGKARQGLPLAAGLTAESDLSVRACRFFSFSALLNLLLWQLLARIVRTADVGQ